MDETLSLVPSNSDLIDRFSGPEGLRRLRVALLNQTLIQSDASVVDSVIKLAEIAQYEPNEILIRQGDADSDIFFILVGSVVISPNGRDDAVRNAGCHVGELSAIDPTVRRSATIRAKDRVLVARLSESNFSIVADEYPNLWRHLARDIARRLRERVLLVPTKNAKLRLFIGSSSEGLENAKKLESEFVADLIEVKLWTDGIFTPGHTNIESLEQEIKRSDFAALLLSPDDRLFSRWRLSNAPRDNLVFELGLFMGAISRHRALVISPRDKRLKLPTDLDGIATIKYSASNMKTVADELRKLIGQHGLK